MKRPLKPEERRLWSLVAATVRPAPGRMPPILDVEPEPTQQNPSKTSQKITKTTPPPPKTVSSSPKPAPSGLQSIEPLRKRRLIRERDEIEARLDLHGLDQDRARVVLHDFLLRSHGRGLRAVLVITGKGTLGDGVLRRRAPDWLSEPVVRPLIAGVSSAARHHGGDGALYIALKRRIA
jgi:DNA-nicking Smr family endonuclease